MALEVIWTKNAQQQLTETITYLEDLGSESLLRRFSQQLEEKLELIKDYPQLYQKSDQLEGARRCVVNKHYSILNFILIIFSEARVDTSLKNLSEYPLLYSHDRVCVYILSLFDNRGRTR